MVTTLSHSHHDRIIPRVTHCEKRANDGKFVYAIETRIPTGRTQIIYRLFSEFQSLYEQLKSYFPRESGLGSQSVAILPEFQVTKALYVSESVALKRVDELNTYLQALFDMPQYILESGLFEPFLCPRDEDEQFLKQLEKFQQSDENATNQVKMSSPKIDPQGSESVHMIGYKPRNAERYRQNTSRPGTSHSNRSAAFLKTKLEKLSLDTAKSTVSTHSSQSSESVTKAPPVTEISMDSHCRSPTPENASPLTRQISQMARQLRPLAKTKQAPQNTNIVDSTAGANLHQNTNIVDSTAAANLHQNMNIVDSTDGANLSRSSTMNSTSTASTTTAGPTRVMRKYLASQGDIPTNPIGSLEEEDDTLGPSPDDSISNVGENKTIFSVNMAGSQRLMKPPRCPKTTSSSPIKRLKVTYKETSIAVKVSHEYKPSLEALANKCRKVFHASPQNVLKFSFLDGDGDWIVLTTEEDLQLAVEPLLLGEVGVVRLALKM